MRKIFSLISVVLFFVLIISGCGCSKGKAALSIGDMSATTYKTITMSELEAKIDDNDSFVLYVYSPTCGACEMFKPILEKAIQSRGLIVYAIQYSQIRDGHELSSLKYTPSLVVYNKGEVLYKTDPNKNEDYFANKDGVLSFLDKYTYMPTMYYISREQLRNKIDNDDSFIIYYSDGMCSDCASMYTSYLKRFLLENNNTKRFYVIETRAEGVRLTDGEANQEQWNEFKREYGLSKAGNDTFGYDVGYVPTLQFYQDGELSDMLVYLNDIKETISENDDGTKTIRIVDSYYDDNPFIGQTMINTEYKSKLTSFYNDKLESFLNNNLPLVD